MEKKIFLKGRIVTLGAANAVGFRV